MATQLAPASVQRPPAGDDPRARMVDGLPLAARRIRPAGISTAVLTGGDGPPLVLLHGGIECGGAMWAPVVRALARSFSLVVPDVPGLGESEPARRLDAATFAQWLSGLVRLTCDEPPVLVAHSLVGTYAARMAARCPGVVRGLVVYGAPGVGPYRLPLGLRVAAMRFGLRPSAANLDRIERRAFADLARTRERDPGWFAAFEAYMRARAAAPEVKATMRQLVRAGTAQIDIGELRRIDVPATLLWGREDRFVGVELAERASAGLGWPLHVVEDAGHVPHIERPAAFLEALGDAIGTEAR